MTKTADLQQRIDDLEEELRQTKDQVQELKSELTEANVAEQQETVEDVDQIQHGWIDVMEMVQDDNAVDLAVLDQLLTSLLAISNLLDDSPKVRQLKLLQKQAPASLHRLQNVIKAGKGLNQT